MKKDTIKIIAEIVLRTAEIRENSYDQTAADKAMIIESFPNFVRYYKKTLTEASEEAATEKELPKIARLIDLALHGWWNDTIDWANEVLKN